MLNVNLKKGLKNTGTLNITADGHLAELGRWEVQGVGSSPQVVLLLADISTLAWTSCSDASGAQRRWAGGGVHTTHHCQKEHSDTAALLLQGRGKSSLSFKRKPQASSNSNGNKSLYQLRALPFTKPFPCLFTITYILGNLLLLGLQRRKWMFPEVKWIAPGLEPCFLMLKSHALLQTPCSILPPALYL